MWLVFLILDGILLTSLHKTFSKKVDNFSTAVLQSLVITVTALLIL